MGKIQGVVTLTVTTDGKKVTAFEAENGPPMLVDATKANVRTWEFRAHKPTTFVTTFEYRIDVDVPPCSGIGNSTTTMRLPQEVRIAAPVVVSCDPATPR